MCLIAKRGAQIALRHAHKTAALFDEGLDPDNVGILGDAGVEVPLVVGDGAQI